MYRWKIQSLKCSNQVVLYIQILKERERSNTTSQFECQRSRPGSPISKIWQTGTTRLEYFGDLKGNTVSKGVHPLLLADIYTDQTQSFFVLEKVEVYIFVSLCCLGFLVANSVAHWLSRK